MIVATLQHREGYQSQQRNKKGMARKISRPIAQRLDHFFQVNCHIYKSVSGQTVDTETIYKSYTFENTIVYIIYNIYTPKAVDRVVDVVYTLVY